MADFLLRGPVERWISNAGICVDEHRPRSILGGP